ncbi:hypothetical protein WJX74_000091 [Apatococcus lobatus]|uniref:PDZ domain-containing protein n=2 Tax=Apatococcus TaxID=904362 RepID=A0AAW1T8E9_9CHLO
MRASSSGSSLGDVHGSPPNWQPPCWCGRLGSALLAAMLSLQMLIGIPAAYARGTLTAEEQRTISLFRDNTPSVVFITNIATKYDSFSSKMRDQPQGAGSGVIWDTQGHIVTNVHVIEGASDVQVKVARGIKGERYRAALVGADPDKDVAVIKIDTQGKEALQPLRLGSSDGLLVGQQVYAIGNPFGLDHTLTTGVISGTGREIESGGTGRPIQGVIQTDAAVNPGNSGGPLLDSSGEAIGLNTAIYSPSGANSGVGFAIPMDIVRSSVEQIIKYGKVVRPVLGISFLPDTQFEEAAGQGILVLKVAPQGPAAKAGIKGTSRDDNQHTILGDVILSMNGAALDNSSDLYRELDKYRPGQSIDLELMRGELKEHVTILLGSS